MDWQHPLTWKVALHGNYSSLKLLNFDFANTSYSSAIFYHPGCLDHMVGGPAGDVNNDGFKDFLVGCYQVNGVGYAAVIYGAASYPSSPYNLTNAVLNRVSITATTSGTYVGVSVAGVGDINNDGFDDFLVSRPGDGDGSVYLIYGGSNLPSDLDLDNLVGGTYIKFSGVDAGGYLGDLVRPAGDANQDGIPDLLMAASGTARNGEAAYYLVYGSRSFSGTFNLGAMTPSDGIIFLRAYQNQQESYNYFTAVDLNGDLKLDACLCSAYYGENYDGRCWLVYGPFPSNGVVDLENDPEVTVLNTVISGAYFGFGSIDAGDINGDGREDLLIGSIATQAWLIHGPGPSPTPAASASSSRTPASSASQTPAESSSPSSTVVPSASPSQAPIERQKKTKAPSNKPSKAPKKASKPANDNSSAEVIRAMAPSVLIAFLFFVFGI